MPIIIPNKVNPLVLSYPDFTLGSIINPDEFDQNNLDIQDKLNEFITSINTIIDNTIDLQTIVVEANDKADATVIALEDEALRLDASDALLSNRIDESNTFLNVHKNSSDHDSRYYTKESANFTFVSKSEVDTTVGVKVNSEVFRIVNADIGDGTFSYLDSNNNIIVGNRDVNYQYFTLQTSDYTVGENRISAIVNDTLHRTSISGGLVEVNSTIVGVSAEASGAEITINYFSINGSLGSSIIVGSITPIVTYYGKIWIDTN